MRCASSGRAACRCRRASGALPGAAARGRTVAVRWRGHVRGGRGDPALALPLGSALTVLGTSRGGTSSAGGRNEGPCSRGGRRPCSATVAGAPDDGLPCEGKGTACLRPQTPSPSCSVLEPPPPVVRKPPPYLLHRRRTVAIDHSGPSPSKIIGRRRGGRDDGRAAAV